MRKPGRDADASSLLLVGVPLVALCCGAVAACGGGTATPECMPSCAAGSHCTDDGCVPDDPGSIEDLAAPATGDLAVVCAQSCVAPTPYCGPNQQCVACLEDSHCPPGMVCKSAGKARFCLPGCTDDTRCGGGAMKCCGGACTDTAGDPLNCGACGTTCTAPNGRPQCVAGGCTTGACNRGWGDCDHDPANGCETNLRVDPKNCTACGNVCALRNVLPACADGCYLGACAFGFDDCNGMAADGCETSVSGDTNNCGACGVRCGSVPNARNACVNGSCQLTGCNNGYSDCDGNVMNGCEILSNSDVRNCGACGNACAQGAVCIGGVCTCPPCNFPNAKAKCAGVQCVIDVCNQNFGDCDGNTANGCERRIDGDVNNCGACGNVCPIGLVCAQGGCTCPMCNIPNAKSACLNNVCVFDSCLPDYGNCDMNAGNGCEVDLRADPKNCGACGKACPQNAPFCTGGACNNILKSCLDYSQGGGQKSGIFNIDPDGAGPITPFQVWCDMETDGGGWTLVARVSGDDANSWMLDTGEWWYDRVMEAGTLLRATPTPTRSRRRSGR